MWQRPADGSNPEHAGPVASPVRRTSVTCSFRYGLSFLIPSFFSGLAGFVFAVALKNASMLALVSTGPSG